MIFFFTYDLILAIQYTIFAYFLQQICFVIAEFLKMQFIK